MYYVWTKILCNSTKDDIFILTMMILPVLNLDSSR